MESLKRQHVHRQGWTKYDSIGLFICGPSPIHIQAFFKYCHVSFVAFPVILVSCVVFLSMLFLISIK